MNRWLSNLWHWRKLRRYRKMLALLRKWENEPGDYDERATAFLKECEVIK